MKHITRIPAPMFVLVDEMLNEELEINEPELRQFMLEILEGKHSIKCYHVREGNVVARFNEDGSLTAPLQGLGVNDRIAYKRFLLYNKLDEIREMAARKASKS